MKTLGYIVAIIILAVLGLFLYSLKNQKNTMNPTNTSAADWSGKYRYHYQVPNADDGTTNYAVDLVKNGAGYDVAFKGSGGKELTEFSAKGTFDNMGDLEVKKDGELMFKLLPAARTSQGVTNLILQWPTVEGRVGKAVVMEKQ